MVYRMRDRIKDNNNEFWESVRLFFLEDFLKAAYGDKRKRKLINNWLRGRKSRKILIRQMEYWDHSDYCSDPLLIEFLPDNFQINVIDEAKRINADVEMDATHEAIVFSSSKLSLFLSAWMRKEIRMRKLWRHPLDHYYTARIFFL